MKFVTRVTARSRSRPYCLKMKKEAAMRQAVYLAVVAALLTATVVEGIAAGAKTIDPKHHFYYAAPTNGISIAVPRSMKTFPTELLPQ
jgi:hypothetical protein